jgi:hypothetical protein
MLQVSELMRAMGFSRGDFSLDSVRQRRNQSKLLGNGVVPSVMEAIVKMLTGSTEAELSHKHSAKASLSLFMSEDIREIPNGLFSYGSSIQG